MKKKLVWILMSALTLSMSTTGTVWAEESVQEEQTENSFYAVASDLINITKDEVYTVTLTAKEGWLFAAPDHTDVTQWLVDAAGQPVLEDTTGVAIVSHGDENTVEISIDASKITSFTGNGAGEIYIMPVGGCMQPGPEGHGAYTATAEKIGSYTIPTVEIEGAIDGVVDGEALVLNEDTITVALKLEGLDDSLINSSEAVIALQDGDGYYSSDYQFTDSGLGETWSGGSNTYTMKPEDVTIINGGYELEEGGRGWSQLGGDGGGNYYLNLGISGLEYNGLPLKNVNFQAHIYCMGRTFTIDGGSLILNTQPLWSTTSKDGIPVLCDPYSDELTIKWPLEFDASALTEEDFSLTMFSEYGDELSLKAGEDFTVESQKDDTSITVNYMHWAFTPVYTKLNVDVNIEKLSWNTEKYQVNEVSHTYDIGSVYVYNVMAGGRTGTQTWTIYGLDQLESWEQCFETPTYTLSYTDENGVIFYYAEDENEKGILTSSKEEAMKFDASEDTNIALVDQTIFFTRRYDVTEEKEVDGTVYVFNKEYAAAESLPKAPSQCSGVTAKPGYVISDSWEEHLRWPWQEFINEGYEGGRS